MEFKDKVVYIISQREDWGEMLMSEAALYAIELAKVQAT